jgi:SNF2 family DNA or RNA helicase
MIVLHAALCNRRFLLWGETPRDPKESPSPPHRSPKRPATPAAGGPVRLVYDAGPEKLREALTGAGFAPVSRKIALEQAVAWVPTLDRIPLASSPLISEAPASSSQGKIAPWAVTAIPLDVEHALNLLYSCVGKHMLKPGVVVGEDLAYWTVAMRFAGEIVARQQFLPDVVKEEGEFRARWTPVISGPDAERLRKLADAMPEVARALNLEPDIAPSTARLTLLSGFITQVLDFAVRGSTESSVPSAETAPLRRAKRPSFDNLHDQWLFALRSFDDRLKGEGAELMQFASAIGEWQRPIRVPIGAPFRLCFRLEEPEEHTDESSDAKDGQGAWHVRYLLQDVGDPSLLIPTHQAWSAEGREALPLERSGFNVREYLLLSLGQASGICPRIEASLQNAAPEGYEVDVTGAHEFLTEKAAVLEQSGFGVMLPAWWTRKGTKLRLTASVHAKSPTMQGGGLSLGDLVQFEWQVALGKEKLTLQELTALADLKAPLVKVRGQWVQMSAEEIKAALDFWKEKWSGSATAREIVQMALGGHVAGRVPGAIEFQGVTATGWVGSLLKQLEGRAAFEELPAPQKFQGSLRPYQEKGYSWLCFLRDWGLGACLADDMGLGKTVQALALIERDRQSNGGGPVLLICPMSVVGNWHKEAARFTPDLPVMVHHGLGRTKGDSFRQEATRHALVISSYALLQRDFETLKQVAWAGVILDEAQNVKNPETKQARAAQGLEAGYRIALTGTPVENNVGDLWSIMEFLNPGFLGTQTDFKREFFVPIQANRDPEAVKRLKRVTGPFILRRLKTDKSIISDLPDKMEMKVFCTLTKEQASLYAAVVKDSTEALESAEGIQRRGVVLATLSKLKQVCNHPAHFLGDNSAIVGRSGKVARLTEMLEEVLEVGDRALIFSQFSEMGEILRRHLQEAFGREVLFLHGRVPKVQRDRMVERFQGERDGPQLFILSLKAGGTGLNLTSANHVFHFDRWWNPAVENQATDRAFRIGQTRNVQVHKFLCVGTLEEKIDEMIERKKEVAAGVVGTGEAWLTELSTAELKEIFALRKEAVEE